MNSHSLKPFRKSWVSGLLAVVAFGLGTLPGDTWAASAKPKGPTKKSDDRPPGVAQPIVEDGSSSETVDLGTRDVLDRLRLLRVQMALDREEIAALQLRIDKINLQRQFETLLGEADKGSSGAAAPKPKVKAVNPATELLVKAISLQPRKEAIIMYRGRIFNVRPGDTIGGMTIQDITQSGLKVANTKGGGESVR